VRNIHQAKRRVGCSIRSHATSGLGWNSGCKNPPTELATGVSTQQKILATFGPQILFLSLPRLAQRVRCSSTIGDFFGTPTPTISDQSRTYQPRPGATRSQDGTSCSRQCHRLRTPVPNVSAFRCEPDRRTIVPKEGASGRRRCFSRTSPSAPPIAPESPATVTFELPDAAHRSAFIQLPIYASLGGRTSMAIGRRLVSRGEIFYGAPPQGGRLTMRATASLCMATGLRGGFQLRWTWSERP